MHDILDVIEKHKYIEGENVVKAVMTRDLVAVVDEKRKRVLTALQQVPLRR